MMRLLNIVRAIRRPEIVRRFLSVAALAGGLCSVDQARADFLQYRIGGASILLQGKATANPGGTLTLQHPMGTLYFALEDVAIHKVATIPGQAEKRLKTAIGQKNADAVFAAGVWALKHGLLKAYYDAVAEALKIDSKHAEAKRIMALREQMQRPLGDYKREEKHLRDFVKRPGMKIATSAHFILLYDTPDKVAKDSKVKKPRHQQRLELLERVYESFLLTFFSRGVALQVPKERMQVVLFNDYHDYKDFSVRLSSELINASGFYLPETNISFFFDHGSSDLYKRLKEVADMLKGRGQAAVKRKSRSAKDIVRLANTIDLLIRIDQESQDIEVVSHEATHQLASNTGLFPQHVRVPSWVHEGLAAYFESPNGGAWSGIGAVNELRIQFYRALERDREHSNIDFIVGDQIFDFAASHGAILHGYGQAWAITHFLMERHFDELMRFYKALGELPPDVPFDPDVLTAVFDRVFGKDHGPLDSEWRSYMRGLKTDTEEVLGGK